MTNRFCVVGSPIIHSISPVIHKAAYDLFDLDFSYDKVEVPLGKLADFLEDNLFSGISVTMPLKYEAFGIAESCSFEAASTKVVNTLVRSSDGWNGHNTDVRGFEKCFLQIPSVDSISILGSGATARSAALAMSRTFPSAKLSVIGRNSESVKEFLSATASFGIEASEVLVEPSSVIGSDLVVSTVPGSAFSELWQKVGQDPNPREGFLFDVAYNPWPSPASIAWGENTISGLELLIWQAIEQVKLFAQAKGYMVEVDDQELYSSMMTAVTQESGLN
jgi:shikimate dehydrogenase